MKVLFVTSAFPADSADPRGIFVLQLARALITSGIDVHVLSPGHPWAANTGSVANVPVTRAPYWRKRGQALAVGLGGIVPNIRRRPWLAVQVPPLVAAMTRSVRKLATDFDVVHAHWVYPSGLACVLNRRQFDAPLVVTAHGGDLNLAARSRVLRQLSRYVIRRVDACIGVGPALVDAFVKLGASEDNAHFIPLGVDHVRESTGPPDDALRRFSSDEGLKVLYVGSLIRLKSVDTLLSACTMLGDTPVTCAIVGDGPERTRLETLAVKLELSNTIFAGSQPPDVVQAWLTRSDVLVLPSRAEGRGMVLLEAMARGVAVVASDVPGPREIIDDGATGLLFTAGSAPELAQALTQLTQTAFRNRLGRAGRAFVEEERMTTAHSAARHAALYEHLLSASSLQR